MPTDIVNFCLNRAVLGTSAGAPDELHSQTSGAGQIAMATAFNSHTASVTVSVYILGQGVAASAVAPVWTVEIPPGKPAVLAGLLGHTVPRNGTIRAFASVTNVARITISGANILS